MSEKGIGWELINTDCIQHTLTAMEPNSVDMSVFSPPFSAMFAYTDSEADLGNVEDLNKESIWHFKYFFNGMFRVMKPGRVMIVHCMQIPRMKRCGGVGTHDFRGILIRLGERAGFVYEYDWMVRKNPQAQAIRTRSRELQFVGLERDRTKSRGTLNDYLIKFVKPGENAVPVCDPDDTPILDENGQPKLHPETGRPMADDSHRQVTRDMWIKWAEGAWFDIRETETLKVRGTKEDGDTKHICPLQIEPIRRLVRLYSNPGELVFSPFAGIGSEGVVALREGRRFLGCELKEGYFKTAIANLTEAAEEAAKGPAPVQEQFEMFDDGPTVDEPVEILDEPEFDEDNVDPDSAKTAEPAADTPKRKRGRPRKTESTQGVSQELVSTIKAARQASTENDGFDDLFGPIDSDQPAAVTDEPAAELVSDQADELDLLF